MVIDRNLAYLFSCVKLASHVMVSDRQTDLRTPIPGAALWALSEERLIVLSEQLYF